MISLRSLSPTHSIKTNNVIAGSLDKEMTGVGPKPVGSNRDLPIYNINKYLEPIAGVLE